MTDEAYLRRQARELRADLAAPDELHVTPIADIKFGRRELVVELLTSQQHGTSCRVRALAPMSVGAGRVRLEQSAFLYLRELDVLLAALSEARGYLVVASAMKDATRASPVR